MEEKHRSAKQLAADRAASFAERKAAQGSKIKVGTAEKSRDEELMTDLEQRRAKFAKRNKQAKNRESATLEKLAAFTNKRTPTRG
jgi:hypothetical protein